MHPMLFRMTIGAENFKVISAIVFAVMVLVMHSKYGRVATEAASLARLQGSYFERGLAHSCEVFWRESGFGRLAHALSRAVHAPDGRWRTELDSAAFALMRYRPLILERSVIAFARAVFCSLLTAFDYVKRCVANSATLGDSIVLGMPCPEAFSGTITEVVPSVLWHHYSDAAHYAAHRHGVRHNSNYSRSL